MDIIISQAVAADVAQIARITAAAYTKYIERINRKPQPMTADNLAFVTASQVWVARVGEMIAGLIILQPQPDSLLIYSVAVDPQWQGQGVGRALLLWAEQEARREGYALLQLYTNETMVENIALYKRIGYHETRREPYKGFNVIYMEKVL